MHAGGYQSIAILLLRSTHRAADVPAFPEASSLLPKIASVHAPSHTLYRLQCIRMYAVFGIPAEYYTQFCVNETMGRFNLKKWIPRIRVNKNDEFIDILKIIFYLNASVALIRIQKEMDDKLTRWKSLLFLIMT